MEAPPARLKRARATDSARQEGTGGDWDWGGIQMIQQLQNLQGRTNEESWHCFGRWSPRGWGEHYWRRRIRGVVSGTVPLRPNGGPFFRIDRRSVSLAQSGFPSIWRGWPGSIEHTEGAYVGHPRGDVETRPDVSWVGSLSSSFCVPCRTSISVKVASHTRSFGLGLAFPNRLRFNRPATSTRRRSVAQSLVKKPH